MYVCVREEGRGNRCCAAQYISTASQRRFGVVVQAFGCSDSEAAGGLLPKVRVWVGGGGGGGRR